MAPEDTKPADSVASLVQAQASQESSDGSKFDGVKSSQTVSFLQARRGVPGGSVVINTPPDVVDQTKTGSSPGVVAGAALGAGALGAVAGAAGALAAMTAKAKAAEAELDKAKKDFDKEKKRADDAEKELAGRPQVNEFNLVQAARDVAIAERTAATTALAAMTAARDARPDVTIQDYATLQTQIQQCREQNTQFTTQIAQLTQSNQEKDSLILVLQQQLEAAKAQPKPPSSSPTDQSGDIFSPLPAQLPSPSAPNRPGSPTPSEISAQDPGDLQSNAELEKANAELRNQYDALQAQYNQLLAWAKEVSEQNEALNQQLSQQQGQMGQNDQNLAQLQICTAANQQLQQDVQTLKQQLAELDSQANAKLRELQTQNAQLASDNQVLRNALDQANQQNGQFKDNVLALQQENNQLKSRLDAALTEVNRLQGVEQALADCQAQLKQWQDAGDAMVRDRDLAISQRDEALRQVQQLQMQLAQLGNCGNQLAAAIAENDQLRADIDNLGQNALAQIDQLTQERDDLAIQLQTLQAQFQALQAQHANCDADLAQAQQDAADQKALADKTIQDQTAEIVKLREDISRLEAQLAAAIATAGSVGGKDAEITRLRDLVKAKEDEIAKLQATLQRVTDELSACRSSVTDLENQRAKIQTTVDALKRENQILESEKVQLQTDLDQIQQALDDEKRKSQRDMLDFRRQLADLQQQLDDCTTRNIALEARLRSLLSQFSGPFPYGGPDSSVHSMGSSTSPHRPSRPSGGGGYFPPHSIPSSSPHGSSTSNRPQFPLNLSFPPPSNPQGHDQSSSIISSADFADQTTLRPNIVVPPPGPSRPSSSSSSSQTDDEPQGGDDVSTFSSHSTDPYLGSLTTSFIQPPAPAPSKKKPIPQGEIGRIATNPFTPKLIPQEEQSPIRKKKPPVMSEEVSRTQKVASGPRLFSDTPR